MAKGRKKKQGAKKRSNSAHLAGRNYLRPTDERAAHNDFRSAGAATRVVPVIERLHRDELLTDEEFRSLAYYRDQASLADKSPLRSCIDFSPKGGGVGPGVAILSAQQETWRIERDMAGLSGLCRAVCVEDMSLEAWCIQSGHEVGEREVDSLSERMQNVIMQNRSLGVPVASPKAVQIALLELKYASGGILRG